MAPVNKHESHALWRHQRAGNRRAPAASPLGRRWAEVLHARRLSCAVSSPAQLHLTLLKTRFIPAEATSKRQ